MRRTRATSPRPRSPSALSRGSADAAGRLENLTELTPNEAATFLNVSRMYVMKLVQDGTLPHRLVGNHHRIPYADLAAYKRQERAKQRTAMDDLYALERNTGIVDGPPPPEDAFKSGGGRGA